MKYKITFDRELFEIPPYVFSGRPIASMVLPDGIISIGSGSFENCTFLESILIPDSTKFIESSAFKNCSHLSSVIIPSTVAIRDNTVFEGIPTEGTLRVTGKIKKEPTDLLSHFKGWNLYMDQKYWGVISEDGYYYYNDHGIPNNEIWYKSTQGDAHSDVDLSHQNLSSIGGAYDSIQICGPNEAGYYVLSISSELSIINIPGRIFSGKAYITEIILPESVQTIDDRAFANCTGLTSINIPRNTTYIGANAFLNICASEFRIPPSVTYIHETAFGGCHSSPENFINESSVSGYPWGCTLH